MHCSSEIDIEEAFNTGYEALKYALEGNNGYMVAIKRENNIPYKSSFFLVEADKVANNVKYFPDKWINEECNNITEEAYNYFKPLLGELPDFKVFTK
jgi:6-phosphofructokinase 1